ncbi:hypothetical protein ASF87_16070 [Microbacterium sp. Leaf161]|uniref:hypothetical protein n=1 Tax=Microbacterium sp. Leaf161 TaxID=1736281 RepID=UPI0006F4FA75|nr:hypothetical protein [Microbacterium sp. Leaf161]KQR43321.1 hypothetical protein ASF87_16070 [Microbacterium sp. Leaf161]
MSTSDQQSHGPLTRKQLREIRLTGSTPVISVEEAAAAAAVAAPPVPPKPEAPESTKVEPTPPAGSGASDIEGDTSHGTVGLTRRQVRERERATTGSVPVDESDAPEGSAPENAAEETQPVEPASEPKSEIPASSASSASDDDDDDEDDTAVEGLPAPVSASTSVEATDDDAQTAPEAGDTSAVVAELGIDADPVDANDDVLADVAESDDVDIAEGERPTVNSAFGQELLTDGAETRKPFSPSFDELLTVGDSTGSQHLAPNTLIFNPSPGDGSLSGPVASTGEILVTGSYELPKGLGSQGHAHGTTDGKDVDAVLIDGELPPASSPTPIAASAAVSTIKPAGEVIRPPAPEKGNKLMLILAIVAGGLALALGVSLIVAFNSNVF